VSLPRALREHPGQLDLLEDAAPPPVRPAVDSVPQPDPEVAHWWPGAMNAIEALGAAGLPFSADQVRELAGSPPRPCLMGRAFALASRRGLIVAVGYGRSVNRSRKHGARHEWAGARS
jgi:hypothetical protein